MIRKISALSIFLFGGLVLFGSNQIAVSNVAAEQVQLTLSIGSVGDELELTEKAVKAWEEKTGHKVIIRTSARSSSDRFVRYQRELATGEGVSDLYKIDVIWPGELAKYLLDLTPHISRKEQQKFFPAAIANNRIGPRLVAIPWYVDAAILFYRKDLLEKYEIEQPPTTWEELEHTARIIQEGERQTDPDFWGYLFQGSAYEGLTCNVVEWIASHGGTPIIDSAGKVSVNNPATIAGLSRAASWVDTISPIAVTDFIEDDTLQLFAEGHAAYMRNWPYAISMLNDAEHPTAGRVGLAPLPAASDAVDQYPATSTLGGWQLAVAASSLNQKEAVDLLLHLTGEEVQRDAAVSYSYLPSLKALYEDETIISAQPFLPQLEEIVAGTVSRPSGQAGARYNQVSQAVWEASRRILEGRVKPEAGLKRLEYELNKIAGSRGFRAVESK